MTIQDILVGDCSVLVKTNTKDYNFDIVDEDLLDGTYEKDNLPNEVLDAISEKGFEYAADESEEEDISYPVEGTMYVHDEATRSHKSYVSDEFGLSKEDEIVEHIADVGREIPVEIVVYEDEWHITHVFNKKLEEPVVKQRP